MIQDQTSGGGDEGTNVIAAVPFIAGSFNESSAQNLKVDARLKSYQKASGISGSASSIGSDTMNNMMALWLEGFREFYPNVKPFIDNSRDVGSDPWDGQRCTGCVREP